MSTQTTPNHPRPEDTPDLPRNILIAGAFGGALVPLTKMGLALVLMAEPFNVHLSYWLGVLILGVLGAGVAWSFGETHRGKAIVLGISLPAFAQVAVTEGQKIIQERMKSPDAHSSAFSLVSSAYAQEPSSPTPKPSSETLVPERSIELSTGDTARTYSAVLYTSQGKESITYKIDGKKFFFTSIPDDAFSIRFFTAVASSASYDLSKEIGVAIAFEITIPTRSFSIIDAIGGTSPASNKITALRNIIIPPAKGTEGWIYLGKRAGQDWNSIYIKLPGNGIPKPNTPGSSLFTLRLRSGPATENRSIGTVPSGHGLTVLDTAASADGTTYWARIRVE